MLQPWFKVRGFFESLTKGKLTGKFAETSFALTKLTQRPTAFCRVRFFLLFAALQCGCRLWNGCKKTGAKKRADIKSARGLFYKIFIFLTFSAMQKTGRQVRIEPQFQRVPGLS